MSSNRFGLGLAALGRPAYMTLGHAADLPEDRSREAMRAHAHEVLDAAFAAGIRRFDAARSYGDAEEFLASWIQARGLAPGDIHVSSKWGYRYAADWKINAGQQEIKDHSLAMLRRQFAESRDILAPFLKLYQIHSATIESGVLSDDAVLDELARLRDGGMQIGVTVSGAAQPAVVRQALAIHRVGRPLFASVQATWNLIEPSCGEALGEAHDAGCLVMIKEPLANGRLTDRGIATLPLNGEPLAGAARALGVGADAVALAAVLAQPWADVVLLGAATPGQVKCNLGADDIVLDEKTMSALARLSVPPEVYWSERSRLPWN
jgi:aryl-alcohol dehydrogenase-like predicted oxidoreductase